MLALVALAALSALLVTMPLASASPAQPATEPARVEAWLLGQFDARSDTDQLMVLVNAQTTAAAEEGIRAVGGVPFRSFDSIGFSSALLTMAQVDALRRQPGITYLQGNRRHADLGNTATETTRVQQAEPLYEEAFGTALDGTGVGIAIVDSGMAGDHPMFQTADGSGTRLLNIKQLCVNFFGCASKLGEEEDAFFVDATGTDTDVMAIGGHGTHVAAIAGGREVETSNGVTVRGVARNADLYGLGAGAGIFTLNSAASLNWVLEHHEDPCGAFATPRRVAGGCSAIKVVNNSYGGLCDETGETGCDSNEYDPDDIYVRLSERLVLEGVTVVWAAGNGPDLTDTDPPANDGSVSLTNMPGHSPVPGVLNVANYDDGGAGNRDGVLNSSSSRGWEAEPRTYPDLSAPGTSILAACRPWLAVCTSGYPDGDYGEISGTSMAAPHVAGVVALIHQAWRDMGHEPEQDLSPGEIEDLLEDTAHQFGTDRQWVSDLSGGQLRNGDHLTSFDAGHGLVDLTAAIRELSEGAIEDPGYDGECAADAVAADPEGDATGVLGLASLPAEASDPNFDISEIGALLDETAGVVRFFVDVADVPESPSPASTGEYLRYSFTYEGLGLQLILSRDAGVDPAEEFRLVIPGELIDPVPVAEALPGSFDSANDRISVDVPVDVLVEANAAVSGGEPSAADAIHDDVTAFAAGDRIEGVTVLMQRQVGVPGGGGITSTTDQAAGGCAFVLGGADAPEDGATVGAGKGEGDEKRNERAEDKGGNGTGRGNGGERQGRPSLPGTPVSGSANGPDPLLLVGFAVVLLGGGTLVARRMRVRGDRRVTAGAAVALALALGVGGALPSADAQRAATVELTPSSETDGPTDRGFTVDPPNAETACTSAAAEEPDASCVVIPVELVGFDDLDLRWLEVRAAPTRPDGPITDLDVYVLPPGWEGTDQALTSSAGPAVPGVVPPTEIAFRELHEHDTVDVLVVAYANLPGATYTVGLQAFGRPSYID